MKRRVIREETLQMSCKEFWCAISDVKNLPLWAKFVTKSQAGGPLEEGSIYSDITTILWIPLKIKHIVKDIKKEERITLELPLFFGGMMWENFVIKKRGNDTYVRAEVSFDLKWSVIDLVIGTILEKRVDKMLKCSMQNLQDKWLLREQC